MFLTYQVRSSPTALKWWSLLCEKASRPPLFSEAPRFRGFGETSESISRCLANLVRVCQLIEEYDREALPPKWSVWLRQVPSQDELNVLHACFDKMRGEGDNPQDYFLTAPLEIQKALEELNESIHEMEFLIEKKDHTPSAIVKTQFTDGGKIDFTEEDYKEFSLDRPFGCLFLHYCQVGKSWVDLFDDQDTVTPTEGVRPLTAMSGEFDIRFGPSTFPHPREKLRTWLQEKGQDPSNPKLALGWVVVADLIEPLAQTKDEKRQLIRSMDPSLGLELILP